MGQTVEQGTDREVLRVRVEDVYFFHKKDIVESGIESVEMHENPKGIRCCSKYTVLPFV